MSSPGDSRSTGQDAPTAEVQVGQLWRSRKGREVLRIQRHWYWPSPLSSDDGWTVRGHPTTGGKPLVCSVTYLAEHYELLSDGDSND